MQTIVLASGNQGKLQEFRDLLNRDRFEIKAQSEFGVTSVDETGLTFVENAILKARHACTITGLPAIADDSGIEVDALRGAPGIYSARFAGENASDEENNLKLLQSLQHVPKGDRTARYQCVLVYMQHDMDPTPIICQAAWEGMILDAPRGKGGFGYDPLFFVPDQNCSAAELERGKKNILSHRGQAMQMLLAALAPTSSLY
jgi:XTP/dITP diphosphohydrolase